MKQELYEEVEKHVLANLRSGDLLSKDGPINKMIKEVIEAALQAEMDVHLNAEERSNGNKRNGKGKKTLRTPVGEVTIQTPQDRKSSFEPQIIKKRERIIGENLSNQILSLYGRGMSLRDMSSHLEEIYGMELSHETLSEIVSAIQPKVDAWRSRPLQQVYPIVWLDAMYMKVKEDGEVKTKAMYNILGVTQDGSKEILGVYLGENESAKFWLSILEDLKNRGLRDILIACIDNLTGFSDAISSIFPRTNIQLCIVHQLRNTYKYVAEKNMKAVRDDIRPIYKATNKDMATKALEKFEEKWKSKYPVVVNSWIRNWDKLSEFFNYEQEIRKLIYTTNPIESLHRQLRKSFKTKGLFPNDDAVYRLFYLCQENITKKWTGKVTGWKEKEQQFVIKFGDRMLKTKA
jgi:transposase-like protein